MTTIQLLERIARRARGGDYTELSLAEQMDCLQAANAAIQRGYNAAPAYLKEQTMGFTLPAPVYLTNVTVTAGSTLLSSGIFGPEQIGQTVQIDGDPQYNQILGPQNLRNPYNGPSGVVAQATIYGDAWYTSTFPFERVIGNPRFTDQGVFPLTPVEMSRSEGEWSYLFQNTLGQPASWWTQMLGNAQGNQPVLVLKFAPFPDDAYSVKVRLSFWPARLLIGDITTAKTIYLPDQLLEAGLIPMAYQELMSTAVWASRTPADDERTDKAGSAGEAFIRNQIADPSAPSNKIYCPLGY